MQLTDILKPECVVVPLKAIEKYQAISAMIDVLAEQGCISDYKAVFKAVTERESVRSTGVGQGFAIPHGKTRTVNNLVMAIGRLAEPIDFESIDGQPVTIIVLLISPAEQTGPHIQALARISRMMTDKQFRDSLWSSQTPEEFYGHIASHEQKAVS